MLNKFKINQRVHVNGIGKINKKNYSNKIGKVILKDHYFHDYLIEFNNNTEDWFNEKSLRKLRKYTKKEQK